jgi:hypothetical protein
LFSPHHSNNGSMYVRVNLAFSEIALYSLCLSCAYTRVRVATSLADSRIVSTIVFLGGREGLRFDGKLLSSKVLVAGVAVDSI